jgi:ferric-dicitrate binding protein FerR (iron transport regulator)
MNALIKIFIAMTEQEFREILSRYEKGQCSPAEKRVVEEWLDSTNAAKTTPFGNETEKLRIKNTLKASVYRKAGIRSHDRRKVFGISALNIAAAILLIAALGFGGYKYYEYNEIKKYAINESVSGGEIKKVILSDGSIIWLKPGSSLKYPKNFRKSGERIVTLSGEALFEVERDPSRPFLVHSGELTTTVLGTSFNIKSAEGKIEVVVLTGKVAVTTLNDRQGVLLLPDEKALYTTYDKELAKIEENVPELTAKEIINGTEYDMKFGDTRVDEIIKRIEGKFNVEIELEDEELSGSIVTADFTGQSLTKTLDIISKVLSIDYKIDNNRVIIQGKHNK